MLDDRALKGQGPSVVEKPLPRSQAHERLRPKLGTVRDTLAEIGERRPHVVKEQIGVEVDYLLIEHFDRTLRDESRDMTLSTPGAVKQFPSLALYAAYVEWSGWSKEPNEVDGEIPIGHAQFAWHVNPLLVLERARDEGW